MSATTHPWSFTADAKGYSISHLGKPVYQVVSIADPLTNAQRAEEIVKRIREKEATSKWFDPQTQVFLAWFNKEPAFRKESA